MYRLKYDPESDVFMIIVSESGEFSHAEEMGDLVIHLNEKGGLRRWTFSGQDRDPYGGIVSMP